MKNFKYDLVVIIPCFNESENIISTIKSIKKSNVTFKLFFIIVDDNSTDDTYDVVAGYFKLKNIDGKIVKNKNKPGAGGARNTGLSNLPNTEFILFFDADDTMLEQSLEKILTIAYSSSADLIITKYQYKSCNKEIYRKMLPSDELLWNKFYKSNSEIKLKDKPDLIKLINYPWNKIIRKDYVDKIDLKFSETIVHNDIYAHWIMMVKSQSILLADVVICEHIVFNNGKNITNISDERRVEIFQALNDVENIFSRSPFLEPFYYKQFIEFKRNLCDWALNRIDPTHKLEFEKALSNSFSNLDLKRFINLFNKSPLLAFYAAQKKFGIWEGL